MEITEILDEAGINYIQKEQDNIYTHCPNCGKDNLSINVHNGSYHCWSMMCEDEVQGGLKDLKNFLRLDVKKFTPSNKPPKIKVLSEEDRQIIRAATKNKLEVMEWAVSRGLDPDFVIKKCYVGYWPEKKAIIIPFRNEKGELVGARARSTVYDTQWTIGHEPDLYILDPKDLNKKKLIYVEGEPDTMTLKQMGLPVVGILGSRKDNWYGMVKRVREHYIGFDADPSGDAGAAKTAKNLGEYRCKRIHWACKDANDMLKDGKGLHDFLTVIKDATPMLTEFSSKKASKVIDEYLSKKDERNDKIVSWGFKSLDAFTKGIQPGWVIYLLAEGGCGKTTLLINLCVLLVEAGNKVGLASYEEHPITEITPKLIGTFIGRNPRAGDFDEREIEYAREDMKNVYLNDELEEQTEDNFCKWVRELYYTKGVRFIIADYLQLIMEDESSTKLVKKTCYKVGKNLIKEMPDLVIIWATQPKQLQKQMHKGEKKRANIDGDDIRGGSPIKQACDALLLMRAVEGHSDITEFEFDKVRGQLLVDKRDWKYKIMQMKYDHDTLRMTETKTIIYGGQSGN